VWYDALILYVAIGLGYLVLRALLLCVTAVLLLLLLTLGKMARVCTRVCVCVHARVPIIFYICTLFY